MTERSLSLRAKNEGWTKALYTNDAFPGAIRYSRTYRPLLKRMAIASRSLFYNGYQAVFCSVSVNTDRARISATSIVLISSSTSFAFVPSLNIVRQNGHALEIMDDSVSIACSVRATLMRLPVVSSAHIRPPPAPQHMPFSRERVISTRSSPGIDRKISLGGSYTPLYLPR